MRKFPEPISNLQAAFSALPGVGSKTALRYVFYLLKGPHYQIDQLSTALLNLRDKVQICDRCFTYCEGTRCDICRDEKRNKTTLCVVEEPRDISTIESTNTFDGLYHVLGGTLNPIDGITPGVLRIESLIKRLEAHQEIEEVIIAISPTVQGEATIMHLHKRLAPLGRSISRLARGLPVGATLEFADEISLGDALTDRRKL